MYGYIVNVMSALDQARPSLWNMSSNVLNATGLTRLRVVSGQGNSYQWEEKRTIRPFQPRMLSAYLREKTCLSKPGSRSTADYAHAQFGESEP